MARVIRLATTAAADAAYAKPKSKRSARDWQIIVDHESEAIEQILLTEIEATHHAYEKLIREALHALSNRPEVKELLRRVKAISEAQRARASKPRKKTKEMRETPPHFLRENLIAYIRENKTDRGFYMSAARDRKVTTASLRAWMKSDLATQQWLEF